MFTRMGPAADHSYVRMKSPFWPADRSDPKLNEKKLEKSLDLIFHSFLFFFLFFLVKIQHALTLAKYHNGHRQSRGF